MKLSLFYKKNIKTEIMKSIYTFYRDGFRNMVLGKKLWAIILIKLFIMFFILKLFFFPDYLNTNFVSDKEKGDYVLEQITRNSNPVNEQPVKNRN